MVQQSLDSRTHSPVIVSENQIVRSYRSDAVLDHFRHRRRPRLRFCPGYSSTMAQDQVPKQPEQLPSASIPCLSRKHFPLSAMTSSSRNDLIWLIFNRSPDLSSSLRTAVICLTSETAAAASGMSFRKKDLSRTFCCCRDRLTGGKKIGGTSGELRFILRVALRTSVAAEFCLVVQWYSRRRKLAIQLQNECEARPPSIAGSENRQE